MTTPVLGIDACRSGWIGVVLTDVGATALFATTVAELVASAGPVSVIAIDMPIGLADADMRQADVLAAEALGPRRSSVFATPVRSALAQVDHAAAVRENKRLADVGISIQAFSLKPKILEIDMWVRTSAPARVVEVHPELSFAAMAGGVPLATRKATWAGAETRRELLRSVGIHLDGDLGAAGRAAAVDDVLDAAAAAWSARRVATGSARSLPDPPETFSDGWPAAIWT